MKKIVFASLSVALLASGFILYKRQGPNGFSPKDFISELSHKASLSVYNVRIKVSERKDTGERSILDLKATLNHQDKSNQEYASEWESFDTLTMVGARVGEDRLAALMHNPTLSIFDKKRHEYKRYAAQSFPVDMLPLELSVLNKVLLPFPPSELKPGTITRNEKDELGSYEVSYETRVTESGFEVLRTWLRYKTSGIRVDTHNHSLRYEISTTGQVLSTKGRLTLHYHLAEIAHYTTDVDMVLKSSLDTKSSLSSLSHRSLESIAYDKKAPQTAEQAQSNAKDFETVMLKISQINAQTDSKEAYYLFQSLKAALNKDPSLAKQVFELINKTTARDEGTLRQLRTLFGALAQSENAGIADDLVAQAEKCVDSFCKMQSIVGVSDHPNPNESIPAKMIAIAESSEDRLVGRTALLAAGSISRTLGLEMPELQKTLISDLENTSRPNERPAVIAAMGNHGEGSYFAPLQKIVQSSQDPALQASAVYSMRYLPQADVNQVLLDVLAKSKNKNVMMETFKTIEYRALSPEQYQYIAKNSAALDDKEMVQAAARVLVQAYQDNASVEEAVKTLRDSTRFPDLKQSLEAEIDRVQNLRK